VSTTDPMSNDAGGRWRLVALAVIALIVVAIGAFLLVDGDDDDESSVAGTSSIAGTTETTQPATSEPATTEPPATEPTAAPTTDTATTTAPDDATRTAIWPWAESEVRFDDPVEAAASYATDFLGFDDPVVGEFRAGDSRSGEVEIAPSATRPTTVVFVRQLTADESWWILGSATENIVLDEPDTGDVVESPLQLVGQARAFEGTVEVEIRADGDAEPIAVGFVTGSGGPEPGPFDDELEFVSPGSGGGALVLISRSPEDGSVLEAGSIRIFFD
jgi:hypothetical protein